MPDDLKPEQFDRLWTALARGAEAEPDEPAAWRELPEPGLLPPPWAVWTLIGLVRHRQRQLWLAGVVVGRLGGDPARIAGAGSFGHPEGRPPRGVVPGLAEWEYHFHGCGCCLTHRVSGESIDVDFHGDHAECFDFYFYRDYLESLRDPPPPERRLAELHPLLETARLAFDDLRAGGLLVPDDGRRAAPRLSAAAVALEPAVDGFCGALSDAGRRAWLYALVGDWPGAEPLVAGGDAAVTEVVAERAAAVRRLRVARLTAQFERDEDRGLCVRALAEAGAPETAAADVVLLRALRAEVRGGVTPDAVQVAAGRADAAAWCSELFALFARLHPAGEPPHPYLWGKIAAVLLRHGHRSAEVAAALPVAGSHVVGDAAMLALEHAPALALPLFRRALRSEVPANRNTAAAALALMDRPWSRAELVAVLAGSDDHRATVECRAALAESRNPAARAAALDWQARHPREAEAGPWVSMGEVALRQASPWLLYEMDELRDRVAATRATWTDLA